MFYTKIERLQIVLPIVHNLKNFKGRNNVIVNLYNDNLCHFVTELKEIFDKYIKQEDGEMMDYSGTLLFEETGQDIEYLLPCKKDTPPLFVIRGKRWERWNH